MRLWESGGGLFSDIQKHLFFKGVVSGDGNMMFTVSRRKNPKGSVLDTRHFKLS
jgi:hypothetical protein